MKRKRQVVIAFAAVAVLAAGYFVLRILPPKETAPPDTYIIQKSSEDLSYVTVALPGEDAFTIDASGQGQDHVYTVRDYPEEFQFDRLQLEGTFSLVSNLKAEKTVEKSPADLSAYGLEKPAAVVDVSYKDGTSDEILVGDQTAFADGYYIMLEGGDTVYTVDIYSGDKLKKNLYFYRDEPLIPSMAKPEEEINYIDLRKNGEEIEIKRDEKETAEPKFLVTKPREGEADGEYLQSNLFSPISALYTAGSVFLDMPQDLSAYGLSQGAARLTVSTKDGEYTILIGGTTEDKASYYVMREGSKTVSTVPSSTIGQILSVDAAKLVAAPEGETAKQ